MVLELPEFKPDTLQAFIQEVPAENRRLMSAFPDEKVYDINYTYEFFRNQARKAAKITGFNSSAPIRNKGEAEKVYGKITKIMDSYYFDETDLLYFNKPRDPEERELLRRKFLVDIGELSLSIDDVIEYIAAQLVYSGVVTYIDPYTQTRLDFEMSDRPEGNDIVAGITWDKPEARPLDDIRTAMKQYQKVNGNRKPERIDVNTETLDALYASAQVRQEIYGSTTDARMVMPDQVNALFTRMGLPVPYVNDSTITVDVLEDGEIVEKTIPHLEKGKVVFYANNMGSIVRGVTKENGYSHGKFVKTKVLDDPENEQVIVGEAAMPTLKSINSNVILKVL